MATAQNKKLATAVAATIAGPILTLAFSHGETLTVDANSLTPDIQQQAMMHGLKQKLIDAAAIARDPDTGRTATIADKFNAVKEVFDRITLPEGSTWNKARGNGDGTTTGNKGGLLARAMMRITSKSRAEITAFLDAKSKDEIAALRKNPRIAEVIAQLQVEQANTSGVDSDALLDSLMEGGGMDVEAEDDDGEAPNGDDNADADDSEVPPVDAAAAKKSRAKRAPAPAA